MVRFGGRSPLEAITAATRDAAELCGVADETGALVAGKAADLVITGVGPPADIDALGDPATIHAVVKEGRVLIDRAGVLADGGLPALRS